MHRFAQDTFLLLQTTLKPLLKRDFYISETTEKASPLNLETLPF